LIMARTANKKSKKEIDPLKQYKNFELYQQRITWLFFRGIVTNNKEGLDPEITPGSTDNYKVCGKNLQTWVEARNWRYQANKGAKLALALHNADYTIDEPHLDPKPAKRTEDEENEDESTGEGEEEEAESPRKPPAAPVANTIAAKEVFEEEIQQETMTKKQPPQSAVIVQSSTEIPWTPVYTAFKYPSQGYNRLEILLDPPGSFDGSEGSYEADFEDDGKIFVFKVAPNPVFSDPYSINTYLAQEYGVQTSVSCGRHQSFNKASKAFVDKWYCFRIRLDWPGKPSDDLSHPWVDFVKIKSKGRIIPTVMINICSIRPLEQRAKLSAKLSVKTFDTPEKPKGVDFATDKTAQLAMMMEGLYRGGFDLNSISQLQEKARKFGIFDDDDAMVEGDEDGPAKKKGGPKNPNLPN